MVDRLLMTHKSTNAPENAAESRGSVLPSGNTQREALKGDFRAKRRGADRQLDGPNPGISPSHITTLPP